MHNEGLNIESIKKCFGKKHVLENISISAKPGSCIGIVGVNGSGKSTFFNTLAGISGCDAGTFSYMGKDLLKDRKERARLLGYITQTPPLIDELTALDNLKLWYNRKELKCELENGVLKMLGIDEFLKTRVSNMSGGMKKRLAIGCAVSHKPNLLLLDEPTSALDLVCKQKIYTFLSEFKNAGGTVIIATHDVQELKLCDKIYIFKLGFSYEYDYDGNYEKLIGNL